MNKQKQIEEMRKIICEGCAVDHVHCWFLSNSKLCPTVLNDTERLYNAGYRRQKEGEWKQTTEPLGAHDVDCAECSACGDSVVLDEDFDFDTVNNFWHFCPNCGAKMKERDSQ